MIGETVSAIGVLAVAASRVCHQTIHINGLPLLLVLVLAIGGVVWLGRRSRSNKNVPDGPDGWPPRRPERESDGEDDSPSWQ
jgi:hypothetical protein